MNALKEFKAIKDYDKDFIQKVDELAEHIGGFMFEKYDGMMSGTIKVTDKDHSNSVIDHIMKKYNRCENSHLILNSIYSSGDTISGVKIFIESVPVKSESMKIEPTVLYFFENNGTLEFFKGDLFVKLNEIINGILKKVGGSHDVDDIVDEDKFKMFYANIAHTGAIDYVGNLASRLDYNILNEKYRDLFYAKVFKMDFMSNLLRDFCEKTGQNEKKIREMTLIKDCINF